MKKTILTMMVMLTMSLLLVACGDKDSDDNGKSSDESTNNANAETNDNNTDTETDNGTEDKDNDEETSDGSFEVEVEDQLNLGIGDTGIFDTTLGTYEITLQSAKLEDEINGEKSELDRFIILDFVVKNTSDETQNVEDLLEALEVTENLDSTGFVDGSEFFEGFEKLAGEIEPNEEMTGKFVTYVVDAEEYYFRKQAGNVAAGGSNQAIWTIKADEAK